jgi:hypothetical protein
MTMEKGKQLHFLSRVSPEAHRCDAIAALMRRKMESIRWGDQRGSLTKPHLHNSKINNNADTANGSIRVVLYSAIDNDVYFNQIRIGLQRKIC